LPLGLSRLELGLARNRSVIGGLERAPPRCTSGELVSLGFERESSGAAKLEERRSWAGWRITTRASTERFLASRLEEQEPRGDEEVFV
jgi:hypothetical protein